MITLVALTAGSVVATPGRPPPRTCSAWSSPRRWSSSPSPSLNIGLAPSATLSLPTLATLLVRGFPAMGMATAVALVLAVFRLITRR